MLPRAIANEAREQLLAAQRRLRSAARGSPGWEQAAIDVELATKAYEEAFHAARQAYLALTTLPPGDR